MMDSDTGCGASLMIICAGIVLVILAVLVGGPTDCRRACEPACMVEWIDASAEQPMVCRCGACP